MTVQEVHILIEQGLQNLTAFAYSDMQREEVDAIWNKLQLQFIDDVIDTDNIKTTIKYDGEQLTLDLLESVTIVNFTLANLVVNQTLAQADLPDKYYHLVNDRSEVSITCNGKIQKKIVPNRLTDKEDVYQLRDRAFHKTVKTSPLSTIAKGKLFVHLQSDFTVSSILVDYIKEPEKIDYKNNKHPEFSDDANNKIIDRVIKYISGITEQSQLKQEGIERTS